MLLRYYGHFNAQTGYARAARALANALYRHSGWTIDCRAIGPGAKEITQGASNATGTAPPDAILVHTLPGDCARVIDIEGLELFDHNPPLIAYTTWEATRFFHKWLLPRGAGGWDGLRFDAVWMPWQKPLDEMRDKVMDRVRTAWIPHTFDPADWAWPAKRRDRSAPLKTIGPADALRFYWMGAPSARKNPQGVLSAFCSRFAGGDEKVALVFHAKLAPEAWAAMMAASGAPPAWLLEHVFLSRRDLDEIEVPRFHREHDVFVTASRGEAWNLPAFEAALSGNWVIAPMGQGSDAFLAANTSSRVTPLGYEPAWYDAVVTGMVPDGGHQRASVTVTGIQGLDPTLHQWDVPDINGIGDAMRRCYTEQRVRPAGPVDYSIYSYPEVARTVVKALEATLNARKT
jgi:glycosyltransferase involved in cell wall biosynthesis